MTDRSKKSEAMAVEQAKPGRMTVLSAQTRAQLIADFERDAAARHQKTVGGPQDGRIGTFHMAGDTVFAFTTDRAHGERMQERVDSGSVKLEIVYVPPPSPEQLDRWADRRMAVSSPGPGPRSLPAATNLQTWRVRANARFVEGETLMHPDLGRATFVRRIDAEHAQVRVEDGRKTR